MKRVINEGVSRRFVNKVRDALAKQPEVFLKAFLKSRDSSIVLAPSGGGIGGTYSTDGTITLYEDSQNAMKTDGLVSAEFVHYWDMGAPGSRGANFSSSRELREAYRRALSSGYRTQDNSLTSPTEFMMALARHVSGNTNPALEAVFRAIRYPEVEKKFAKLLGA